MAIKNTTQTPTHCGTCLFFPLKEALEAGGHGYCRRMEKARGYDWPATVLYNPAINVAERHRMVEIFLTTQQQKGKLKDEA
jgi:hypothetical protein